ncbi:MAG: type II secretory pathway component [Alteromonadaceae bacterium]|nr:type II secretory pathway component [Alteromonadaceae bacterium]MBL4911239.1 type II secretory pathway component [Alteromonadaceae bacterium]
MQKLYPLTILITVKQQGSALLLALFVMIVLMLFGTRMVDMLSTSSENIAQEVIGTRALAAANSGMQARLQQLFPLNGGAGACLANPPAINFINIVGLQNCKAITACNSNNYLGETYYRLKSTGTCGSGTLNSGAASNNVVISSRTVQVEAKGL